MQKDEIIVAKDFLRGYKREDKKLKILEEELKVLYETIDSMPFNMDGMPKGNNIQDSTGKRAIKQSTIAEEIMRQRDETMKERQKIKNAIIKLKDSRYMEILYSKYIKLKRWEQIAVDMNMDLRYIFRLHNQALCEIYKIIN